MLAFAVDEEINFSLLLHSQHPLMQPLCPASSRSSIRYVDFRAVFAQTARLTQLLFLFPFSSFFPTLLLLPLQVSMTNAYVSGLKDDVRFLPSSCSLCRQVTSPTLSSYSCPSRVCTTLSSTWDNTTSSTTLRRTPLSFPPFLAN
jgi:hypothetical protein